MLSGSYLGIIIGVISIGTLALFENSSNNSTNSSNSSANTLVSSVNRSNSSANSSISSHSLQCDDQIFSEEKLFQEFIIPHSKLPRPVLRGIESIHINATLFITALNDILERERIIRLTGFLQLEWFDELRKWDDSFPYNCVDYITVLSEEVWLPDIAQTNSREHYNLLRMPDELIRIHKDGHMVYSPGGTLEVFCSFDITWFPFDYQQCSVEIESWMYTSKYLVYHISMPTVTLTDGNEQWSIINTSESLSLTQHELPNDYFNRMVFSITVKRKVMYYLMNVIIPSIIIAFAHLTTFMLPSGDIEKVNISFTCLLAYSVFQVMVVTDLPRSSDNISLLSIYINLQMAYIALSMTGEGLAFYAVERAKSTKLLPPSKFTHYWTKYLGLFLCVGRSDFNSGVIAELNLTDASKTSPAIQWLYICQVIERAVGLAYFLAVAVSTLIMFGVYPLLIVEAPE